MKEPCLHERIHGYRTGCGSAKGAQQLTFMQGGAAVRRHVSLGIYLFYYIHHQGKESEETKHGNDNEMVWFKV